MPLTKRYHLSGYVWHLTHCCHKREFLLKFARDRRWWTQWLFEAKKQYGLCIPYFMVPSNHVHVLVFDSGNHRSLSALTMQLIAGRSAQIQQCGEIETGPSTRTDITQRLWKAVAIFGNTSYASI